MADASRLRKSKDRSFEAGMGGPEAASDEYGLQDAIGNSGVARLAAVGAQAKLEVGGADDAYEQEADLVADEVMGGPVAQPAREVSGGAAPEVQREGGGEGFAASDAVSASIGGATGGQSLDGEVRAKMEAKTGASFDGVRVHDDAEAHATTAAVGAHAFTHGQDIHFAKGAYDPGSKAGQHLLAHELTHVVQQSGGQTAGVQRKAISAAPASVQRKSLFGGLFGGKKKQDAKQQPSYDEMLANPTLKDHWVEWNAKDNWGDKVVEWNAKREAWDAQMVGVVEHAAVALDAMARDDEDLDQVSAYGQVEWAIQHKQYTRGLLDELKPFAATSDTAPAFFKAATAYTQAFDRAAGEAAGLEAYLTSKQDELNVVGGEIQRVLDAIAAGVFTPGMMKLNEGNHAGDRRGLYNETYSKLDEVKQFHADQA